MRKLLFFVVCFGFFAGCEKAEKSDFAAPAEPESENVAIFPEGVPARLRYAEALAVAEKGIQLLEDGVSTRAKGRMIDASRVKGYAPAKTRSGEADTLMYVFNFADSAGFAVVSSFRETEQLLAVTESGSYTPGEPTGISGLDFYLSCLEDFVAAYAAEFYAITPPTPGLDPKPSRIVDREETKTIAPMVSVAWGQEDPYNKFCKKEGKACYAGCVATAIAQIMSVYEYPASIGLTYEGADKNSVSLNWEKIKNHHDSNKNYGCSDDTHNQIGYLFREIGKQVDMEYNIVGSNKGSKAYSENVPGCFKNFGYSCGDLRNYNYTDVYNSLSNNKLVYSIGSFYDEAEREYKGHAWVIDGDKTIIHYLDTYEQDDWGVWILVSTRTQTYSYHHCNWGWDGSSNGYFTAGVFSVSNPYELDEGSRKSSSGYNFNTFLQIISNIYPQ